MKNVTRSMSEGCWPRGVSPEPGRWRRILALALLLLPGAVLAGDTYYPEYKHDPVPPVAVVEDPVVEDEGAEPACVPANADCDEPAPQAPPPAVAVAD